MIQHQFYKMIIIIICLLCLTLPSTSNSTIQTSSKSNQSDSLKLLAQIQGEIDKRITNDDYLNLKFTRLNQNTLKKEDSNLNISNISILPSISIPYKDNIYYSMIIRKNNDFYTLRGDLIYSSRQQRILVNTLRNQQTFFAEFYHQNNTMMITKLRIVMKKVHIQMEISLEIEGYGSYQFDNFIVANHGSNKHYILSSKQGLILFFDKLGHLIKQIQFETQILKVQKISSNIVVLTQKQLFFLNMNKNFSKVQCVLPYQALDTFQYDQSNLKYIYGKKGDSIYQFQLNQNCKPIKHFNIHASSDFYPAGQLIFVQAKELRYTINITSGTLSLYQLPVGYCSGLEKIQINRKIHKNYIISQICLGERHINLTHILVQMEDSTTQVTDFSKFRIPLLFFSFGIIIYVTVKNRGKKTDDQTDQKLIQQNLMKKIASMKQTMIEKPIIGAKPSKILPQQQKKNVLTQNLQKENKGSSSNKPKRV